MEMFADGLHEVLVVLYHSADIVHYLQVHGHVIIVIVVIVLAEEVVASVVE